MSKFTPLENKKHWDEFAKKYKNNLSGASYDSNLVDLENLFIISELKKIKPKSLLDIGCGNGQRTKIFSKFVNGKTLGIDYSDVMIKHASSLENKNLKFENIDICNFDTTEKFDVIISCRCIINQTNSKKQVQLFKLLHYLLKSKGNLLIAEASVEGLKNLNSLRRSFSLVPIEEHWFNTHIKESYVFPKINKFFKINKINRLGLFYYLARVVNSAISFPKEAKRVSKINEVAKKSQILFFNSENHFEKFGRHLLVNFQKK